MIALADVSGALLPTALKATALLALAAIADRAVLRRHASAAARHLHWCLALAGLMALPVLGALLPAWRVPLLATAPAPAVPAPAVIAPAPAMRQERVALPDPTIPAANTMRAPDVLHEAAPAAAVDVRAPMLPSLPSPASVALALYVAGVVALLLKVAAEQRLVRRLARDAAPVDGADWHALLDDVRRTLGVRRGVTLLRGGAPTIPLTWGVVRPTVLLPSNAADWSESRRRAVLLHEVAHIARRDCLTQTLAAVVCALYWPHPGAWWAAARLRVERELACDDAALARGIRPRDYAGHLLELARGAAAPRGLVTLAVSMATPSQLESRLRAAIDGTRVRTAPGARARTLGALLTAVLLAPVAALRAGAAADVAVPDAPVAMTTAAPAPAPTQPAAPIDAGTWHVRPASRAEAGSDAPAVHVMVTTNGITTFVVPLARMEGLTAQALASDGDSVRFRLRRDGGTFEFRGTVRAGRGTGRFGFTADPAFGDALARRGIGRPSARQIFSLALHDVSLAFLDALDSLGYAVPSPEALVRLGVSGADERFLRDVSALGYRFATTGALVSFANSGVTPAFIRAVAALGYRDLRANDLVQLQNHSLDASAIARLNARAGRRLSVAELVAARTTAAAPSPSPAPVPERAPERAPEPAAEPARAVAASTPLAGSWVVSETRTGYVNLRLNWDDGTNWDRWVPIAALRGTSAEEIGAATRVPASFRIEQDAGVLEFDGGFALGRGTGQLRFRPKREFAATLRALGVAEVGEVSDHQLKNLTWGGMSADAIRALGAAGIAPLTLGGIVDLAIFQVTPDYAQALRAMYPEGRIAADDAVDLKHGGIPATYLRELAALGYRGLDPSELSALWRERVTPGFIRAVRESRAGSDTPESLIALRRRAREQLRER
ncbi:M56 family metallopeptidase [Roseisolibacter agri]|uniref:Peptidase M56 domain-containing protein n=1 Tax=Roseisolibacter agri TaxID=2014610 RepID=A0AA37PZX8_9BACT|nr:M56 family metallopeptidase [Roseisolibacter agri]GLC23829.1 hypothetical protein rosag_03420 [Roseisolibacter agri]